MQVMRPELALCKGASIGGPYFSQVKLVRG